MKLSTIFNLYWRIRWRLYDRKFKRYYRVGRQNETKILLDKIHPGR